MRRSRLALAAAFVSVVAVPLASLAVAGCSGGSTSNAGAGDAASPPSTSRGDAANDVDSSVGPVLITDPDQGMSWFYALIGTATKSIDMTMYELTDTTVTGLLTQAAKSGIAVRVILDQNLEMQGNTPAYDALTAGGVQVHWANAAYAATHQKTITVDATTSAIMTMNLTPDDYVTSRDFAVITTDAADVAAIEAVFAEDFVNAATTPPTGDDLVWSPTNAKGDLVALIEGATSTLIVENEEMSDDAIVSALSSAAEHGIDVKLIMEDSENYQSEFETLQAAGVDVVVYRHAALYIHAKAVLSDFGSAGAKAFVGSENFTNPSLTENRELGLITTAPAILASLDTTLQSDFDGGTTFRPFDGGPNDAGSPDALLTDASPADANPADANPVDANLGDANLGDAASD